MPNKVIMEFRPNNQEKKTRTRSSQNETERSSFQTKRSSLEELLQMI